MKKYFVLFSAALFMFSCARPIANFTYDVEKKVAPSPIKFKNQSKKAESYEWDFGDGKTSSQTNPHHVFKTSGNYTIVLKAKKGEKVSTYEQKIFVEEPLDCLVELQTDFGNMTIKLYNSTPKHRDNFIKLVEEGFYDGLLFHRVINGFMIQGGDPESKNAPANKGLGSGGPGYQIPAEFNADNVHVKGALAAARTNNPQKKSSGSQFYIVHGKPVTAKSMDVTCNQKGITYSPDIRKEYLENGGTPFLDNEYTVFGKVIDGLEVIDKIAATKTGASDRPTEDVKMKMKVIK